MAIRILITDRNLNIVGDPLDQWTNLDVTTRFNEPASGSVTLPAWSGIVDQLQPGRRLVVVRDGQVWAEGPLEVPQDYAWGMETEGGPGRVTVNFTDDLAIIAGYLTWPIPAVAWSAQTNAKRNLVATSAETIIRTLVNENCGPGAQVARRIPNLVLDTAAGIGSTISATTRLEPLLEACRRVAVWGGGLGFRTRVEGGQILFGCYATADKTSTARFSAGLGNLRSVQYKMSAPTVTHALVQGPEVEAPASRVFVERSNPMSAAAWWRVEQLVDGPAENDTNGELTAAGNEAVSAGSAPVELATVTVDIEDLQAGRDFDLGDRVTIELPTGLEVVDRVLAIHLQATPDSGEYVTTLVGSPEATSDPGMVRLVRELGRRLGRIEAR